MKKQERIEFHTHTFFSENCSLSPRKLIEYAASIHQYTLAIMDDQSNEAFIPFSKEALTYNRSHSNWMKIIYGAELLVKENDISYKVSLLVKNEKGLKNLEQLLTIARENGFISRNDLVSFSNHLFIGSNCIDGEILLDSNFMTDTELENVIRFYDYIEVEPPSCFSDKIGKDKLFLTSFLARKYLKRIVQLAKDNHKLSVATGNVHSLQSKNDFVDRHFRTTEEMKKEFSFLPDSLISYIVMDCPNKLNGLIKDIFIEENKPNIIKNEKKG